MKIKVGVLTVSDRASSGEYSDRSGPAVVSALKDLFKADLHGDIHTNVVPDVTGQIQRVIIRWVHEEKLDLIFTTGGTGFTSRDVTPEAVSTLFTRSAQSIATALLVGSLQITPMAALSRAVAGMIEQTLVVTLPGSVKGATECIQILAKPLPHALAQIKGVNDGKHAVHHHHSHGSCGGGHHHHHHHSHGGKAETGVVGRDRKSQYPMLQMADALKLLEECTPSLPPVKIHLTQTGFEELMGRILSEDVVALQPFPPFRASIKDGYAVKSAGGAGEFPVQGVFCAGTDPSSLTLQDGKIIRVSTGSAVPDGADAVVQVEDTELLEADKETDTELRVRILKQPTAGQDIRPIGCDMEVGQVVLEKGTVLGSAEIGLLCALGYKEVNVYKQPTVAILSTGDELVPELSGTAAAATPAGKIFDSNRQTLLQQAKVLGCKIVDLGIASDNEAAIREKIEQGFTNADMVITSGGVSMGELDLIKPILLKLGAEIHFGRVSMKPGKPTTFATLDYKSKGSGGEATKKVFFGLPGNPVSALVCLFVFGVPSIRKLMSHPQRELSKIKTKNTVALRRDPERVEYHRVVMNWSEVDNCFHSSSTGLQASHRLISLRSATGLAILQPGTELIPAGSMVDTLLIA
eukprot:TRINITY_DN59935_c0_g1_i1.p1 TRINITY_DN59935_c0_g1~~TRINITY_DN59935_c0_g1_i1.p1  ORF type:complete len:635 (-),score=71.57 TRINITY_DN59935_c0_g1_i1:106-2010(-)